MSEKKAKEGEPQIEVEEKEEAEEDSADLEIEKLHEEVENLKSQIQSMKDDDLRRQADTENYRKRLRLDKENAVKYANESLINDLLTPLDNFSRAIEAAEKTEDFEAMKTGVKMVEDQMLSLLKQKWGLESIETKGKKFDPNEMEAYSVVDDPSVKEEMVKDELMKGYKLNGKVLRTAKVVVSKPVNK